jgi:ribose/xylose/arabinose/galactoside ABC-type transport system permease subunit
MDGSLNDGPNMTDARPATSDAVESGAHLGRTRQARQRAGRLLRGSGILLAFVVLIVLGALQSEHFLTFDNFSNVARQASIAGILGIGMTFVILTAGIDLSVGSILGIVAIGYASILANGMPWPLAIVIALGFGAFVGSINGLGITRGGIQPFIMTLGMLVIARGVTLTYSDAKPIRVGEAAADIAWIGTGTMLGLPVPFVLFMGIAGLAWFTLKYTTFGRQVYAVGDNLEAARLSGIPTRRVIFSVYVISGICAAVSALIVVARLGAAEATQGEGFELDAIAIVVIGGTSLFGGRGAVIGSLIGALIVQVFDNGLALAGVDPNYQVLAVGVLVIVAVAADQWIRSVKS